MLVESREGCGPSLTPGQGMLPEQLLGPRRAAPRTRPREGNVTRCLGDNQAKLRGVLFALLSTQGKPLPRAPPVRAAPAGDTAIPPQAPRHVPRPLRVPTRPGHRCTLARAAAVPVPAPALVPRESRLCSHPLSSAQKAGGLTRASPAALGERNSCGATCLALSGLLPGAAAARTHLVPFLQLFLSANSQQKKKGHCSQLAVFSTPNPGANKDALWWPTIS